MQERTETSPVASFRREWTSLLGLGMAVLVCPCHLLLVLIFLAGTTLGAWMSQHRLVVTLVMLGMFVVSLLYAMRGFDHQCLSRDTTDSETTASSMPTREKEAGRVSEVQRL